MNPYFRPLPQGQTKLSMATTAASNEIGDAQLSQDQFNAFVQNTYGRYPLTIVRGDGCKLYDSDGKVWNIELSNIVLVFRCHHSDFCRVSS